MSNITFRGCCFRDFLVCVRYWLIGDLRKYASLKLRTNWKCEAVKLNHEHHEMSELRRMCQHYRCVGWLNKRLVEPKQIVAVTEVEGYSTSET